MAKQRIALLFGGVSSDSHKYLPSVRSVAEALSEKQYEVVLPQKGNGFFALESFPYCSKRTGRNTRTVVPLFLIWTAPSREFIRF